MRIPPHWAKQDCTTEDQRGKELRFWAWGWSFESVAAALVDAKARAQRICDHFAGGTRPDTYSYLEHPLREEIVETFTHDDAEAAVITRNRYGCLVLNTPTVCFVDVDYPPAKRGAASGGLLAALLGLFSAQKRQERAAVAAAAASAIQQATLDGVRQWFARHPERAFRVYQTAAGLRLLFTDGVYDPKSPAVASLLNELGSDPLYRRLTLKQESFRARLTPKPWRCGCRRPPLGYPWEQPEDEQTYRRWQENYERAAQAFGTCRFVEALGAGASNDLIERVVALHDQYTCGAGDMALA